MPPTSTMVRTEALFSRSACRVSTQHRAITPSTPVCNCTRLGYHERHSAMSSQARSFHITVDCKEPDWSSYKAHSSHGNIQLKQDKQCELNACSKEWDLQQLMQWLMQMTRQIMRGCQALLDVIGPGMQPPDQTETGEVVLDMSCCLRDLPVTPMPSTRFCVSRNGTSSGVLRKRPCSKATPRSMCTTSAERLSMRMLFKCLSPKPMMYPANEQLTASQQQSLAGA